MDDRRDLYNGIKVNGDKVLDVRYAEDTALLSDSTTGMDNLIWSVKEHSEEKGILLNVKKMKLMDIVGCKEDCDVGINNEVVEVVNFEYLGSQIATATARWRWKDDWHFLRKFVTE